MPKILKGANGAKLFNIQRGNRIKVVIQAMTLVRPAMSLGRPGCKKDSGDGWRDDMSLASVAQGLAGYIVPKEPKREEKESPMMME